MSAFVFQLFVAGQSPNSMRALRTIQSICQQHLAGKHQLEIIDVLEQPARALAEGVLVTPTLLKRSPGPARRFIGDLSQTSILLDALGLSTVQPGDPSR